MNEITQFLQTIISFISGAAITLIAIWVKEYFDREREKRINYLKKVDEAIDLTIEIYNKICMLDSNNLNLNTEKLRIIISVYIKRLLNKEFKNFNQATIEANMKISIFKTNNERIKLETIIKEHAKYYIILRDELIKERTNK